MPEGLGHLRAARLPVPLDEGQVPQALLLEWEDLPLEKAMDMIADRLKKTRDETWEDKDERGKKLNRSMAVASIGGPQ